LEQKKQGIIKENKNSGPEFIKYESGCAGVPAVPPDTPDIEAIRRRYLNYMQKPEAVWLDGSPAPFRHIWQIKPSFDELQLAALAAWELANDAHGVGVAAVRDLCLTDRWGSRAAFKTARRAAHAAGDELPRWVPPLPVYQHNESGELRAIEKPDWIPFGQFFGAAHHPCLNNAAHAVHLIDYPYIAEAITNGAEKEILADVVI
jgi:hypothetical protein